jgi:hypothetical protein
MGRQPALPKFFDDSTDESSRLLNQIRGVLMLVDQYLLLCRLASQRYRLEPLVRDVIVQTTSCFTIADLAAEGGTAKLHSDHARCLLDLESFAQSLCSDPSLSYQEIEHAMDSVLVSCLLLDAEWRQSDPDPVSLPLRI